MAALVCEICGGKLMAKSGGIFECEFCGMQYDKARIQEMVQEIKGTVKVEGTVEVTGTVKLDGPVEVRGGITVENLLKRAHLAAESEDWTTAKRYFEQVLDLDAECVEAYLGKFLAYHRKQELQQIIQMQGTKVLDDIDFQRALRFMDSKESVKLREDISRAEYCIQVAKKEKLRKENEQKLAAEREAEEKRIAEEARRLTEDERLVQALEKAIPIRNKLLKTAGLIATGSGQTVGISQGGGVLAIGANVGGWRDIVALAAHGFTTIGLKRDGTVVAKERLYAPHIIKGWRNIVAVSASFHVVGLCADGTVVATGHNEYGQCNVCEWTNIIAIAAGGNHTVGLKADGTVVAVGRKNDGQCKVGKWKAIIAVAAGWHHTVGLRADGTVVAIGHNREEDDENQGQCNVSEWSNIVGIAAGSYHTVGLKADGTVVATGEDYWGECSVQSWRNIVAVYAGDQRTYGLKADGTIVATGFNKNGECNIHNWRIYYPSSILENGSENTSTPAKLREAGLCQHCGGDLKGFFSKKCVKCGKPKDY